MRRVVLGFWALMVFMSIVCAPMSAAAAPAYTFRTGAVFNDPTVPSQQYNVLHQILDAIAHTPKGANVYIATYTLDNKFAADTLIAAHKRGVNIKILADSHNFADGGNSQVNRVKAELGSNRANKSFIYACSLGCMSSNSSAIMHAKFYLISTVGLTKPLATNVVMSGSANLSTGGAKQTWNDEYTMAGNATVYQAFLQYFNDMKADKDRADYSKTVASGIYKAYFYPQAYSTKVPDNTLQILKNIRCTGADTKDGYGNGSGNTVVRIGMQNWSAARLNLANQLWKLDDQGCDVQVMYGMRGRTAPEVLQALLKKGGRHGGVKVYMSNFPDADQKRVFIHYKQILVNGNYLGNAKSKIVFTGSGNFDWSSLRVSNEQMLKIANATTYQQYIAQYNFVRDNHSVAITTPVSPAAVTPAESAADAASNED